MTHHRILWASLVLMSAAAPLVAQDTAHVVIVSTTDIHGHVTGWDLVEGRSFPGGLTRAATVIDSLRLRHPGQVVLVDAGDLIQGDPFATYYVQNPRSPHPIVDALDAMEYDVVVPGNHEFDHGFAYFQQYFTGRNLRPACANCILPGAGREGSDSAMFPPYYTLTRGGVRVAVAGLTNPGANIWSRERLGGKLRIAPIGDRSVLFRNMRAEADVVVALVHSGMDGAASYDTTGVGDENVAASFAQGSTRPDVVVVGHSHREMRDSVINGVHFVQPQNNARSLSVVHLSLRRAGTHWQVTGTRAELVPLANVPENARMLRRLEPLLTPVKTWATEWVGHTAGAFDPAIGRAGASPLAAWMGEVMRRTARTDLAATPVFNTRHGLPADDVHRADLFAIYPYENTLRGVKISGADLRAYLEQSARYYVVGADGRVAADPRIPGFNFDIVVGAEYDIDLSRPIGQRVTRLERRGRAIAPTESLTIALNDYRQAGGGGFAMLFHAPKIYDQGESIRALLEASVARDSLDPRRFARETWRILPRAAEDQVRLLTGATPRPRASAPRDTVQLRILALNDLHGQLDPRVWPWSNERPIGGVAYIKTLVDSLANECGCPVVRIDAGDEFQGTLASNITFGRPVVEAFNRIGIQATAVGNHDLDWGVDTLRHRVVESRHPWLAVNIVDSATGQRPDWLKGWTMLNAGTKKVAVIGYAHPNTPSMTMKAAVAGLRFLSGPAPIQAAISEARGQGADFVVLLAHFGGDCRTACTGELFALVDSLGAGAVDAVIGGHSHWSVRGATSSGIPVLQGGSSGRAVARIDFIRTVVGAREVRTALDTVWADRLRADRGVDSVLARYRPGADSLANRRVAELEFPLQRRGNDHALGRLIADAYRNALRTDLALANNGGIRRDLPAGALNYGTAYELMPFGNRLVKVTMPGRAVKELLEAVLNDGSPDAHLSGATVRWDSTAQRGRRVKEVRLIDGRRIDDGRSYTVAVPDFMAQGGEQYGMLTRHPQDNIGLLDLDAFVGYLRRLPQPVRAPADPRFVTR